MDKLRAEIYAIVASMAPMTVRQVFYQLSTRGLIEKTEAQYKQTVCRLLSKMRLDGDLPFSWIADNSRWMRKPESYSSLRSMLDITTEAYRRAIWDDQDVYVEIWLEKEALSGVIWPVTQRWDVPLMVTRGYPSLSFLHSAAQAIEDKDKPTFIYYFGDLDPSGLDIARNVEDRLNEFADADIRFERLAVTREQVQEWNLPTRPTKSTDTRAKSFAGASVELDAIDPVKLRQLVESAIEQHVDHFILATTKTAEASEQTLLDRWDEIVGSLDSEARP